MALFDLGSGDNCETLRSTGVAGRAYYEAAQIKLQRNRMQIRNARTQNMLLHAALLLLTKKEQIAHKQAGDLEGMHKNAKALHQEFDDQRCRTIAMQLEVSHHRHHHHHHAPPLDLAAPSNVCNQRFLYHVGVQWQASHIGS